MSQYKFNINGNEYNVEINSFSGDSAVVTVNGIQYTVESGVAACTAAAATIAQAPAQPAAAQAPAPAPAPQAAPAPAPQAAQEAKPAPAAGGQGKPVTAPLPGVIIEISVKTGDTVKQGQQVAVLEAMKMENVIEATPDGTVSAINVNKGESVLDGTPIVTIA